MTPNARNSTAKPEAAMAARTGTPDAGGLLAELRRLWAHQTAAGPAETSTGRGAMTGTPDGSTLATPDGITAETSIAGTDATAGGDGSTAPAAGIPNVPPINRPTGTARTAGPAAPAPGEPAGIPTATGDRPTGTPARKPAARKPTAADLLAARPPRRCLTHTDPADYLDEPASNRPGYIRTVCRRCGCFLGYRPAEPEKRRRTGKAR